MEKIHAALEALAERMDALEHMADYFKKRTLPDMRKEVRSALGPTAKIAAKMVNHPYSIYSLYITIETIRAQMKNLEQGKGIHVGNRAIRALLLEKGWVRDM